MEFSTDERESIVKEAKNNFNRGIKWESSWRQRFIQDVKFANADSENLYQWEDTIRRDRHLDNRPCLTINKTHQHNLLIINDAKENKPGVTVRPVGNGATYEAAQVWAGIIRKIEYLSNASVAYDLATEFQVQGGKGYWRVVTDYANEESFDQEIFIKAIADPLTVLLDPFAQERDKSDARWGFIFEEKDDEVLKEKYPKYKHLIGTQPLDSVGGWVREGGTRVAEYYRVVETEDKLHHITLQDGSEATVRRSHIPKDLLPEIDSNPLTKTRTIRVKKVEWFLIIGSTVVEHKEWPGSTIPIIPLIGEETVIDGQYDCKGHTRFMKDPQRMYNYWSSSAVEFGALQTKTPWIAAVEAIEGYEDDWKDANTQNKSILPYNAMNDAGEPIPPPQRIQPPVASPVALQGMQIAQQEIMMVSGQYQSSMGEQGNERSGRAINERQRQGEKATYHFIDNLGIAIRRTGKIFLELIPKIYDTKRVLMALGEDGMSFEVELDPQAQELFKQEQDHNSEVVKRVLNPSLGQWDVQADIGPAYATKREEAFNAFTLILTQAPQLAALIGDLLLQAGDFPMADEAAARLKRMVPPAALGKGPTQNEQQLQQQIQQLQELLQKTLEQNANDKIKIKGHAEKRDIEFFNAVSKRLQVLQQGAPLAPEDIKSLVAEAMDEAQKTSLDPARNSVDKELGVPQQMQLPFDQPPVSGARKAPDGEWYAEDPLRKGKYLKVRHGVTPQALQQSFLGANGQR